MGNFIGNIKEIGSTKNKLVVENKNEKEEKILQAAERAVVRLEKELLENNNMNLLDYNNKLFIIYFLKALPYHIKHIEFDEKYFNYINYLRRIQETKGLTLDYQFLFSAETFENIVKECS